jgi:hypothetical protein
MYLVPQPGSKPEFLAGCVPVDPSPAAVRVWEHLCASSSSQSKLVLEGYTRDGWAWKPGAGGNTSTSAASLVDLTIKSVDGRNKLPGFVKYLKERTKSAYGRFGSRGVLVVSYVQPAAAAGGDPHQMTCRVSLDLTGIPQCALQPLSNTRPQAQAPSGPSATPAAKVAQAAKPEGVAGKAPAGTKSGLLGKLVGAQQRTNQHMISTAKAPLAASSSAAAAASGPGSNSGSASGAATPSSSVAEPSSLTTSGASRDEDAYRTPMAGAAVAARTYQEVFAEFRQSMQDKMLDFDMAEDDEVIQVTVTLSEHTAGLSSDDRAKVTMEVLKYMVYEAAEEVNEEWVVHKEPSEFVDEATFSVYKEGAAPPEVIEEINRAELPEEMKAQQRAIAAERQRLADQANHQHLQQVTLRASQRPDGGGHGPDHEDHDDDDQLEALNQQKRDRRTIEDYERQKRGNGAAKKGRL